VPALPDHPGFLFLLSFFRPQFFLPAGERLPKRGQTCTLFFLQYRPAGTGLPFPFLSLQSLGGSPSASLSFTIYRLVSPPDFYKGHCPAPFSLPCDRPGFLPLHQVVHLCAIPFFSLTCPCSSAVRLARSPSLHIMDVGRFSPRRGKHDSPPLP